MAAKVEVLTVSSPSVSGPRATTAGESNERLSGGIIAVDQQTSPSTGSSTSPAGHRLNMGKTKSQSSVTSGKNKTMNEVMISGTKNSKTNLSAGGGGVALHTSTSPDPGSGGGGGGSTTERAPATAAATSINPPGSRISKPCCFCWCCCYRCTCLSTKTQEDETSKAKDASSKDSWNNEPEIMPNLEEIRCWGDSFDRLMKSSMGRAVFREFLKCEYSEENILFWLACEDLKKESNPEVVEEKARLIYEDYISILSPKEVSLDSRVREIVNRNMVDPTPHTFDEAQLQIYTLMHRDSYPRFVNSSYYKKLAQINNTSRKESSA